MRKPPAFFQAIAEDARTRWERLEADPESAGPWHVLFAEVKRPRFVLSELIQNADDAGATVTAARIAGDVFEFRHDGEDFDQEAFKALCTFGRSSKRRVHSIGLWGIGFKSLFSLGPDVEVITPTIAVTFRENRFSEPQWLPQAPAVTDTVIRVRFRSSAERNRMEGEFVRWRAAPWTLLFLRHVRAIELEGQKIRLEDRGPGPTRWSSRFALGSPAKGTVLVFRSDLLPTPQPVLEEVRALRSGATDVSLDVSLEVALGTGSDGSLFCGLPTDFKIALPFAINAPFILEPGREFPKDPDVSPTNRWLFGQVGGFVANQLLAWLADPEHPVEERAQAYSLLPSIAEPKGEDLADRCARLVRTGLIDALRGRPIVLCDDGELRDAASALDVPPQLQAVWPAEFLSTIAGRTDAVPVATAVPPRARDALFTFAGLQRNDQKSVVTWLTSGRPIPRPATLDAIELLWSYLSDLAYSNRARELAILPVEGEAGLLPAERVSVVHLDGALDADLTRLFQVRPIIDQAFLVNCQAGAPLKGSSWRRLAEVLVLGWLGHGVKSVRDALADLGDGLRASGTRQDILAFCRSAFRLGAKLKGDAPFLCQDGEVRDAQGLYADFQGKVDELLPQALVTRTHIAIDYITGMASADVGEFSQWLWNNHVDRFPPPAVAEESFWGRKKLEKLLKSRRGGAVTYRLQGENFKITDFDWESAYWTHWTSLSASDPEVWAKLAALIATTAFARDPASLRVYQSGYQYDHPISCGSPIPAWVARFAERQCVPLEAGGFAHPAEAFRRTEATRHLSGQLPFLKEALDREEFVEFWSALGVRTDLADPEPVLQLWRRLASQDVDSTLLEIGRILDALDAQGFPPDGWTKVRKACLGEALIPAEDKTWQRLDGVVLENPDHLPGSLAIHPSLRKLGVWRRLDVPTRPSRDLVLEWVKGLPEGEDLDRATKERLRSVLQAHAVDVASQLQRWLSMRGQWYRIADFTHVLRGSLSLELFDGVADHIADTRMIQDGPLPEPLDALPDAAASLSTHVDAHGGVPLQRPEWVVAATDMLLTVGEVDEGDRMVLEQLSDTEWARASSLEVTPYLDRTPAGPPKAPRAAWDDDTGTIYITQDSAACASDVLTEITSKLRSRLIQRVLTQCYDRPRAWVESCLKGTTGLDLGKVDRIAKAESPEAEEARPAGPEARGPRASRGRIRTEDQSPPSVAVSAHERVEAGERVRPLVLAFIRHLGMDVDERGSSFVLSDGTIVPSVLDNGVLKLFGNGEIAHEAWVTEEVLADGVTIPAHILPALQRLGDRGWIVCRGGDGAVFAHPAQFKISPAQYRLRYLGDSSAEPSSESE